VRVIQARRILSASEPVAVEDPYFRHWVLLRAMPDGRPHVTVDEASRMGEAGTT
jgi:hypothetical protein